MADAPSALRAPAATAAAAAAMAQSALLLALPTDLSALFLEYVPLRARIRVASLVCRKLRTATLLTVRDLSAHRLHRLMRRLLETHPDLLLHFPNLTGYFVFARVPHITALAPRIRLLRVFYYGDATTDASIPDAFHRFTCLTSLEVSEANKPATLALLQQNAPTLTDVKLTIDERFGGDVPILPRLRSLNLLLDSTTYGSAVASLSFHSFAPMLSALTSLSFQPAPEHLPLLCLAPRLASLSVGITAALSAGISQWIRTCLPSLTALRLAIDCPLDEHVMQLLNATRCLTQITIMATVPDQRALADALAPHTKLRTLVLRSPEEGFDYLVETIGSRLTCASLVDTSAPPSLMIHLCNLEKIYLTSTEIEMLDLWPHSRLRAIKIDPCVQRAESCGGVRALHTILRRFPTAEYVRTCMCARGEPSEQTYAVLYNLSLTTHSCSQRRALPPRGGTSAGGKERKLSAARRDPHGEAEPHASGGRGGDPGASPVAECHARDAIDLSVQELGHRFYVARAAAAHPFAALPYSSSAGSTCHNLTLHTFACPVGEAEGDTLLVAETIELCAHLQHSVSLAATCRQARVRRCRCLQEPPLRRARE